MPPSKDLSRRLHKIMSAIDWAGEWEVSAPSPYPRLPSCRCPRAPRGRILCKGVGVGWVSCPQTSGVTLEASITPGIPPPLPAPGYSCTHHRRPTGFHSACGAHPSGLVWLPSGAKEGMGWRPGLPTAASSALSSPPKTKQGSFVSGHTQGRRR